jgi:hypothetical protein
MKGGREGLYGTLPGGQVTRTYPLMETRESTIFSGAKHTLRLLNSLQVLVYQSKKR